MLTIENNAKNRITVKLIRFAVFLMAIFKTFYIADGMYNSGGIFGVSLDNIGFYILMVIALGGVYFLLSLLTVSLGFSTLVKSRYSPIDSEGISSINYCTFHIVYLLIILCGYAIQGVLGLILYFYPITMPLLNIVISKLVAVAIVVVNMALLSKACPKGQFKQLFVAMLFPNILAILLLG